MNQKWPLMGDISPLLVENLSFSYLPWCHSNTTMKCLFHFTNFWFSWQKTLSILNIQWWAQTSYKFIKGIHWFFCQKIEIFALILLIVVCCQNIFQTFLGIFFPASEDCIEENLLFCFIKSLIFFLHILKFYVYNIIKYCY